MNIFDYDGKEFAKKLDEYLEKYDNELLMQKLVKCGLVKKGGNYMINDPKLIKETEEQIKNLSKEDLENAINKIHGYWNTRVIKTVTNAETYYAIHEVYYNGKNEIWSWSQEPIPMYFEEPKEFWEIMKQYVGAMRKPVLIKQKYVDELEETNEILWEEIQDGPTKIN